MITFSPFMINSLVLFYPTFCGVALPLLSPLFFLLRICIVLLRAAQANCPG